MNKKPRNASPKTAPGLTRRQLCWAMGGMLAQLSGCGGGESLAGLSTGGTGSFTVGPVLGLGSIIVNGVRFDDTGAEKSFLLSDSVQNLKLGMVVSVQSDAIQGDAALGTAVATAKRIVAVSEWKGPVTAKTAAGFQVLGGFEVLVGTSTVKDLPAGRNPLEVQVGDLVEVYGFLNSTGQLKATRVEVDDSTSTRYRVSGVLTAVTAGSLTLAGRSFAWTATQTDSWGGGDYVRLELDATGGGTGPWAVRSVTPATQLLNAFELTDDDEAEFYGVVTTFQSAGRFSVNGLPVDASGIQVPEGLKLGSPLEVEGRLRQGILYADEVKLLTTFANEAELEIYGTVSQLNTGAGTFEIRGYRVNFDSNTRIESGWETAPKVKVKVELRKGEFWATEIEVERED